MKRIQYVEAGHKKVAHRSDEMVTDKQKGDDSRLPIEIWYRRSWTYQGMVVSEALNIIL